MASRASGASARSPSERPRSSQYFPFSAADAARLHVATDERGLRLVEAARALMREAGEPSFTVAQVVAAARTSLKGFYRCFDSKDELLVALFADDARRGADALAALVDAQAAPRDRLRVAVQGLFQFVTIDGRLPYAASLVREHLRLAEARPDELRRVLQPLLAVFERELCAAQAAGTIRAGDPRRDARMLFHLVTSQLHALICHQTDDTADEVAEHLWGFCAAALRPIEPGEGR